MPIKYNTPTGLPELSNIFSGTIRCVDTEKTSPSANFLRPVAHQEAADTSPVYFHNRER